MQTIWASIDETSGLEYSGLLIVENPPFMRLVIEALPEQGSSGHPVVSIAHYGEPNGNAMRDPEICGEIVTAGHQRVLWPYYFRNDYAGVEWWNRSPDPEGSTVCLLSKTRELEDFMAIRDRNLRDQGFLEVFRWARAGKGVRP